ncbi:thioredoxin reductase 1, cytoplasmic-like isoform 2-T2 [Menidia menidia]
MDPPARPSLGLYDYDYDFLVIGGGSGSLAAAMEAAALSKKVLVLDFMAPSPRGTKKELGGSSFSLDRVRKFLQQTSLLGKAIEDSQKFGWKFKEEVLHGWSELVQAIQDQVKSGISELKRELKSCGVHYLQARGEIVAPHTVEVTDMNGRKRNFKAETLVIATGDKPHYLDIPGVIEYCITSEDLLSQRHPPGRTLVVGGSAEGLECAGFLFGLGMMVTVMLQPGLLPGCDRKMAAKIENHMIVSGVNILHQCSLSKVEQIEDVLSVVPSHPSIHPSIVHRLFEVGSRGQQPEQGNPGFPLPGHFSQLLRGDPEAFPGQPGHIVPPAGPGSSSGPSPGGTSPEHLPREVARRHPDQMPEPPQLAPLHVEEQRLYSEPLPDGRASHPISKGEPSHPAEETHFGRLYPRSRSFSHYPKFVTVDEGGNVDRPIN